MSGEKVFVGENEQKLRCEINVSDNQFDFLLERSIMEDIYILKKLIERFG